MRPILATSALAIALVGCSNNPAGSSAAPPPTKVASLGATIVAVVAAGGAVYCSVGLDANGEIDRIEPASGDESAFATQQRAYPMSANAKDLIWKTTPANATIGDLVQAPLASAGARVLIASDAISQIGADDSYAYWTVKTAVTPHSTYDLKRAPLSGGTVETLASGLDTLGGIATDANNVYFVADDGSLSYNVYSLAKKAGSKPVLLAKDVTGLGGAHQVAVDDANVYFLGQTGGGAKINFVAAVPKGGGAVIKYDFGCEGVNGIAVYGGFVYATCDADLSGFNTTRNHSVKRAPIAGGAAKTIARLPPADGSSGSFGAPTVDSDNVYFSFGDELMRARR